MSRPRTRPLWAFVRACWHAWRDTDPSPAPPPWQPAEDLRGETRAALGAAFFRPGGLTAAERTRRWDNLNARQKGVATYMGWRP